MAWLLGFGIPIGYFVTGFLMSRALYRSRHKRGYNRWHHDFDTQMAAGLMVLTWPIFAPLYFTTVIVLSIFKTESIATLGEKFYNHRLPMTNEEKRLKELEAQKETQRKIKALEKELGISGD